MCEHEFAQGDLTVEFCKKCGELLVRVHLEQQLSASNAEIKALRNENELLRHKSAGHDTTMLRAELATANAKIDEREIYWETHYRLITKSTAEQLAAANARIAELEKDNARQKRLATISRLCKNVQSCRAEKAEQRAEQAEARCAAVATAYQIMKGDFEHWAYCELIDSPPGKKCTCGVWEMVSAIKNADSGTAILESNKRMREALELARPALVNADSDTSFIAHRYSHALTAANCPLTEDELLKTSGMCRTAEKAVKAALEEKP